jgi:putative addiction module component (TIGR02574 family)
MTAALEEVTRTALTLPAESRAALAARLLESLDEGDETPLSPAWREEIRRRDLELSRGDVAGHDGEKVLQELRARFS